LSPQRAQGLIPRDDWFLVQQVELVDQPYLVTKHLDPSRGSDVLKGILTETLGGILGSDHFSAYYKYLSDCGVLIQFCWAL